MLHRLHSHSFGALLGGHAVLSHLLLGGLGLVAGIKSSFISLHQRVVVLNPVGRLVCVVELVRQVANVVALLGLAECLNFELILLWRE